MASYKTFYEKNVNILDVLTLLWLHVVSRYACFLWFSCLCDSACYRTLSLLPIEPSDAYYFISKNLRHLLI